MLNRISIYRTFAIGSAVIAGLSVATFWLFHTGYAGSLTPSATPTSTSYTLGDIYTRLTTNATSTEAGHSFSPAGSPSSTLYTLTQIYSAIPTITASSVATGTTYLGITGTLFGDTSSTKVCANATYAGTLNPATTSIGVGNTICGVSGTLLGNMFNGTGDGVTGGSQASGGVGDYLSDGSSVPSNRYSSVWTQCAAGNNYCGTGLTSANAKDNATGLIWSYPCNGAGCDSFSNSSPMTYAWASSTANVNNFSTAQSATSTAPALCTNGDHGQSGWFLPHQRQLMQAFIDGSYGNLQSTGGGSSWYYWSATSDGGSPTQAWAVYLTTGYTYNTTKATNAQYVRCVR